MGWRFAVGVTLHHSFRRPDSALAGRLGFQYARESRTKRRIERARCSHFQGAGMDKINQRIATELGVGVGQVAATVELLGEGATVPFIARYRKEKTGGLDDTQLRKLDERLGYLRELEDRRATVLKSIEEQGKLTPELVALHRRRADQGRAGRPVRALQAQAPHQGADRPRGRPRAARRRAARQPRARPRRPKPPSTSTPTRASRTPRPRSTAPATS